MGIRTKGIDVSRWQDDKTTPQKMNFQKAAAQGVKFVFIKSSQEVWADQDIIYNWQAAKDAGLLRGAYHFMTWNVSPEKQAECMWSLIKNDPGEIPPVIDYEWWSTVPANADDLLRKFARRLENLCGRKVGIYTSSYFFDGANEAPDVAWRTWLWVANYRETGEPRLPKGWDKWTFWQWSNKGDGLLHGAESKELDMNWFNGSLEDLRKFCGLPGTTPPPQEKFVTTSESVIVTVLTDPNPLARIIYCLPPNTRHQVMAEVDGWIRINDGWINKVYTRES